MSLRPQSVTILTILLLGLTVSGCVPDQPGSVDLPGLPTGGPPPTSTTPPSTAGGTPLPATQRPPTPTAPEPYTVVQGVEELVGTWMYSDSDFTRFYEDGTVHEAYSFAQLDDDPYAVNRYSLEDGRLSLRELSVSGVPPCGSRPGVYEVRLLQSGSLQIVVLKDACGPRAGDVQGIYERVP